jgi:SIR2-like domain
VRERFAIRFGGAVVTFHDPRREVEKLREQLASHENPIVFLIGAGASCAVRDDDGKRLSPALIPAATPLGELCAGAVTGVGEKHREIYDAIATQIQTTRGSSSRPADIEEILSAVRLGVAAMGPTDSIAGGTREQLQQIEEAIRGRIAQAALPDEARIPTKLPHHALARWVGRATRVAPVELFTTNYDTLLERALEDEHIAFYDGFVGGRRPFFLGATPATEFDPGRGWTRLWKIHGSVTWAWEPANGGGRRIARGPESPGGELILPSFHKYDESRRQPYASMLDRFARVLTAREDTLLITAGYSFSDEHLNAVIFDALQTRARLQVVALQYSDVADDHELLRRAARHPNLVLYGPERATAGGVTAPWRLAEPVDERTADLLDVPFDSDAQPDKDLVADTGRFRLGDFYWLGRFLDRMSGADA